MSLAYHISAWNRRRKWRLFQAHIPVTRATTILDIGFSDEEYSETDNFLEKQYPYPEQITALGIDAPKKFSLRYPNVKAVQYDGNHFPFPNKTFDVCWSNAVIEHVGGREAQLLFLKEMCRVGTHVFFTTPNRCFPFEIHTRTFLLHFFPKTWFDAYLRFVGKPWATGQYMHLLDEADLRSLLAQAGVEQYRLIKNRLLGFTLDFVVII